MNVIYSNLCFIEHLYSSCITYITSIFLIKKISNNTLNNRICSPIIVQDYSFFFKTVIVSISLFRRLSFISEYKSNQKNGLTIAMPILNS